MSSSAFMRTTWRTLRKFGKTCIGQSDEPGDFNLNTAVHVTLLAHERAQGIEFAGITAIQR